MSQPSKKLILHIGFHKTGTSALQEGFYANADALAAAGLIYPKPLCKFQSHIELPAALFPDEVPWVKEKYDLDEVCGHYANIVAEAPAGSVVVLSSEELCRIDLREEYLRALHDRLGNLPDTRTQIVAYTRDAVAFLVSLYHHEIRVRVYHEHFRDFVNGHHVALENVRFDRRLEGWRATFRSENVLVQDYDQVVRQRGPTGITEDFLNLMGLSDVKLDIDDKFVNTGVHPWLVAAYSQLYLAGLPKQDYDPIRDDIIRLGFKLPRVNAAEYYLGEDGVAELRARIADHTSI